MAWRMVEVEKFEVWCREVRDDWFGRGRLWRLSVDDEKRCREISLAHARHVLVFIGLGSDMLLAATWRRSVLCMADVLDGRKRKKNVES